MQSDGSGSMLQHPESLNLDKLFRLTWPIGFLGSIFNIWNCMECNIFTPYLYTRVQCCGSLGPLPHRFDITDLDEITAIQTEASDLHMGTLHVEQDAHGNRFIPACSVPSFPSSSTLWSKSAKCVSTAYVRERSQRVIGITNPLQTVATLLVLPVGGVVADRFGRKPVLYVYAVMCILACLLFVFDAKYIGNVSNAFVFMGIMLICPCWEPKETVLTGAISDILGLGSPDLGRAMALLQGFFAGGWLSGFVITFIVLGYHLESYFIPWVFFTAVAVCILIILNLTVSETLPQKLRRNIGWSDFNPITAQMNSLSVIWHDRLLVILMLNGAVVYVHYVGFITLEMSLLTSMGFSLRGAMLPKFTEVPVQLACCLWLSQYSSKIGAKNLYVIGNFMFVLAYLFYGPLVLVLGHASPYIANAFFGIALGCFSPAVSTIIAKRVGDANQVKCLAGVSWTFKIGCAVGPPVWNFVIYDAMASGWAFTRPAFVSLIVSLATTGVAFYLRAKEDVFPSAMEVCERPGDEEVSPLAKSGFFSDPRHSKSYGTDGRR